MGSGIYCKGLGLKGAVSMAHSLRFMACSMKLDRSQNGRFALNRLLSIVIGDCGYLTC